MSLHAIERTVTMCMVIGVIGVILSAMVFDVREAMGYPTNQPVGGVQGNVDKDVMVVFIHGLSEPRSKLSTYLYWGDLGLPFDMEAEVTVTDNLTNEGYSIYRSNEANTNLSAQGFSSICDRGSYRNCIFYENYYNLLDNPWLHGSVPTPIQFCEARFPVTKEIGLYVGVDPTSNTLNAVIQQMCKHALLSIGTVTNSGETIFINPDERCFDFDAGGGLIPRACPTWATRYWSYYTISYPDGPGKYSKDSVHEWAKALWDRARGTAPAIPANVNLEFWKDGLVPQADGSIKVCNKVTNTCNKTIYGGFLREALGYQTQFDQGMWGIVYAPRTDRKQYVASVVNVVATSGSRSITVMAEDAADQIKQDFDDHVSNGYLNPGAQLILVGHSMGGLVARAISTATATWQPGNTDVAWVRNRTIGITTIATPHKGSWMADYQYQTYVNGQLKSTSEGQEMVEWLVDRYLRSISIISDTVINKIKDQMLEEKATDVFNITPEAMNDNRISTLTGPITGGQGGYNSTGGLLDPGKMTYAKVELGNRIFSIPVYRYWGSTILNGSTTEIDDAGVASDTHFEFPIMNFCQTEILPVFDDVDMKLHNAGMVGQLISLYAPISILAQAGSITSYGAGGLGFLIGDVECKSATAENETYSSYLMSTQLMQSKSSLYNKLPSYARAWNWAASDGLVSPESARGDGLFSGAYDGGTMMAPVPINHSSMAKRAVVGMQVNQWITEIADKYNLTKSYSITVNQISTITTESGGQATFTMVLGSQPTANVTIGLTSDKPTEGAVSPASLTFTPANWSLPQPVTVTGVNDSIIDGSQTFNIITGAASSSDHNYNGINPSDVGFVNFDNDKYDVFLSQAGSWTTEAGGQASFAVALTMPPSANVTIAFVSNRPTEGVASPASVTFTPANWITPRAITVTGVNDDVDDGDQNYTVITGTLSSADTSYNGLNPPDVLLTNFDNDTAGITVTPTSGLVTSEAGGTAGFTVVLNSQPTANVTIGLTSSDATEGTVSPASLIFTPSNWSVPQTVTVTGVNDSWNDNWVDGNQTYTVVTTAASSADLNYVGMNPPDVALTNIEAIATAVYAATTNGLSISRDGGQTFVTKTNIGLRSNQVNDVYASGRTVYAATNSGVSVSRDGGVWFTSSELGAVVVNGVFAAGNKVYAGTKGYGLVTATDVGTPLVFATTTLVNADGSSCSACNQVNDTFASGSYVFAATDGGLFISTDSGQTFAQKLAGNIVNAVYYTIAQRNEDTGGQETATIYAATSNGLSIATYDVNNSLSTFTTPGPFANPFIDNNSTPFSHVFVNDVFAYNWSHIYAATANGLAVCDNKGERCYTKTTCNAYGNFCPPTGLGSNMVNGIHSSIWNTFFAATNGGLSVSLGTEATSFTNKTTANGLLSNTVLGVSSTLFTNLAPTVSITSPATGALLHQTATITATATDDVAVAQVEFYLNSASSNTLLCKDMAAPYACAWNTTAVADGTYTLQAKAVDTLGLPGTSASITVTVDNTPPAVPSGVVATPVGSGQINLAWTISNTVGVAGYQIESCKWVGCGNFSYLATVTGTSYSDISGLIDSTSYSYRVRSFDTAGNLSGYSALASATTLWGPTSLSSTDVPNDQGGSLRLTWNPSIKSGVTEQRLYRMNGAGAYVLRATFAGNTTYSYIDSGLNNGILYYYVVRGYDGTSESVNSNVHGARPEDNIPPVPPSGLTVMDVAGDDGHALVLTWTPSTSSDAIKQHVLRATSPGGPYNAVAQITNNTTTNYTDTGLNNRATYYYAVQAGDTGGWSVNSATASAMPLDNVAPSAPTGLTVTDVPGDNGDAQELSWTPSSSADVTQQSIYRAATAGGTYTLLTTTFNNTASRYTDKGLTSGTSYYYIVRAYDGTQESINSNEAVAAPIDNRLPDLWVSALNGPASASPGGTIIISATVDNQGGDSAGASHVGFYLSSDTTISTSDTFLFTATVDTLPDHTNSSRDYAFLLTDTLALGNYYLGALADYDNQIPEGDETNNGRAGATIITITAPDLVMTAVSGPASAVTGGTISVSNTVKNQGTASAGNFIVSLYLSTDATITTQDTLLGSRTVTGLGVGASSNTSTSVKIPSIAARTYYLGAIADTAKQVVENIETNNTRADNSITISGAELAITAVSGPSSGIAGGSITLSATRCNQGTGSTVNGFNVGFYLSTDTTISTADILLGAQTVSSLNGGACASDNATVTVQGIAARTYYVGAIVDYAGQVPENNETNNGKAGNTIAISGPELVMTALSGPSNATRGSSINLSATACNQGTGNTINGFEVGFYLSTDATITAADTFIGTHTVTNGLNAGACSSGTPNVTIPRGINARTYYLGAIADSTNQILEANESNNARTGNTINVTP